MLWILPRLVGRLRSLEIVMRFTLIGLAVGLIVTTAIALVIDARLTTMMLARVAERAVDQVDLGVQPHVSADDFTPPFTDAKYEDLARRLNPVVAMVHHNGVIRLNVFAMDGTILYSDRSRLRGEHEAPDEDLFAGALRGTVGQDVSDLEGPENSDLRQQFGNALEVYAPVTIGGQVIGVYEIYQDLSPIRPIRPLVWTTVFAGLLVLFCALLLVMREAASQIRRQQTERERLLSQAADADTLRQLNRLKSELLAAVSHELRSPLSVVAGYAELLAAQAPDRNPSQIRQVAQEIHRGSLLMARMVADLIDFNQIERGVFRLERQSLDLANLTRESIAMFAHDPQFPRLRVEVPTKPVAVEVDPARVSQIVVNLISNALRYAPTGPVTVRLTLVPAGEALLEVRDEGPGIPLEVQSHLWEMFYRAPEVRGVSIKGTGIGLALVKQLTEAHGGSVDVVSRVGQGATFRVHLPVTSSWSPRPERVDQRLESVAVLSAQ